jgi:hypothetical protein
MPHHSRLYGSLDVVALNFHVCSATELADLPVPGDAWRIHHAWIGKVHGIHS